MKQSNKFLLSIFFLFLFLELLFLTMRHHDIHWDEAVYISMGKWIYSFGKEGLFESIRPLGLPLLLGFFWKLGLGTATVYQFLIFLFALGALFLTWKITEKMMGEETALIAVFLLAITPFFFLGTLSILTEIPALFFILLTIYFFIEKKHQFVIGLAASSAFLFKFPAGLLFLAIIILYVFQSEGKELLSKKSLILFALTGFLLVQLPFFLFNYISYKAETTSWFDAVFRPLLLAKEHAQNHVHTVPDVLHNLFYYPLEIFLNNPVLGFSLVGVFFLLFWKEERKKAMVLLIPLSIFLLYFTTIENKQLRFALLFLPFMAILAGNGIFIFLKKQEELLHGAKKWSMMLFLLIAIFLVYPQFVLVYSFFPTEILPIETEYYSFFSVQNATGTTILTTEPYFTAYTNQILAIPYYNNVTDAWGIYEKYKESVDYIVFTPDFYPCETETCRKEVERLEKDIRNNNHLLYEKEWSESNKIILKKGNILKLKKLEIRLS